MDEVWIAIWSAVETLQGPQSFAHFPYKHLHFNLNRHLC